MSKWREEEISKRVIRREDLPFPDSEYLTKYIFKGKDELKDKSVLPCSSGCCNGWSRTGSGIWQYFINGVVRGSCIKSSEVRSGNRYEEQEWFAVIYSEGNKKIEDRKFKTKHFRTSSQTWRKKENEHKDNEISC